MPRVKLSPRNTILPEDLLTIEDAAIKLGRGFSRKTIIRRIDSGEWEEGIHWVDDRRKGAQRRIIKINIAEVNKLRGLLAGER